MNRNMPEILGGMVDSLFLLAPRVVNLFKPPRDVSQTVLESHLDFYIEEGFTSRPATFFTFPDRIAEHRIIHRKPYQDGEFQLISFPSGYEPRNPLLRKRYLSHSRNATGYMARWTHGTDGTRTVLCLHGYLLGDPRQAYRMFRVRKLFGMGLDVALFITPFHWMRSPESKLQQGIFLQPDDPAMTCECMGQAMFDLATAAGLLKRLGSGGTGLIGASLGGYLAALHACLAEDIDFSALMVPAVNLSKPLGIDTARFTFPVDPVLHEKMRQVWELHSPLHLTPRIPRDRILVIASRGDLLCPFESVQLLCERWGLKDSVFLRGGHWLIFDNAKRGRAWYSFLKRMRYIE